MVFRRSDSGEEAGAIQVASCPCVTGGKSGRPECLPVETVDARECVALNAFEPWLNRVLAGHARDPSGQVAGVVAAFIAEVYLQLGANTPGKASDGDQRGGESCLSAGGESCLAGPPAPEAARGRAAMGLDEDSDQEQLAAQGEESHRGASRLRGGPPAAWATVSVRGKELTVRKRPRGRGILVPLEGPDLPVVLGFLLEDMRGHAPAPQRADKRRRADRGAVELLPADKGKVVWLTAAKAWQVVYTKDDGSISRMTKHLAVPVNDRAGRPLDLAAVEEARRVLLFTARRRWNELDRSERQRYDSDLCELPESS